MLASQSVIDDLVQKLNTETNVPFISEGTEELMIRRAVTLVAPHVPDYVLQMAGDVLDGLTDDEVGKYRDVIITETNKLLDLPKVPEFIEAQVIAFVVDGILSYAKKGSKKP